MKAEHPENNPMHALSQSAWTWAMKHPASCKTMIAIDAGANDGGYTHTLLLNDFTVHAFEPVPKVFAKLQERYASNPKVYCNQLGLSDYPVRLTDMTIRGAWTLVEANRKKEGCLGEHAHWEGQRFDVEFTTIDAYLGGSPLSILKLDVDGYEHKVLAGGSRSITAYKPPILCELGNWLPALGGSPKDFISMIFHLGYQIVSMDGCYKFDSWAQVEPHYPWNTTFDVVLLPTEQVSQCMKDLHE